MKFNKKLAAAVSGAVLLMAGQVALADSTTDIVDALVAKGVLTEEEGKLISKGHESKKKADGTVAFKNGFKINSGDGKSNFSVNGRIQADYRYFDTPENSTNSSTASTAADTFDIRRAYIGAKGTFRNFINYEATIDGAGSNAYLKYFWLETAFSDAVKVRFGQFKPSFGLEQNTSSRFIDMTERDWAASIAIGVTKGVMVHGSPTAGVNYALYVNNGAQASSYLADASQTSAETRNAGDGKQIGANLRVNIAEILANKEAIMHLGGSYAREVDASRGADSSLAFRTNARGTTFFTTQASLFPESMNITRMGLEGIGAYGPLKLQAEYAKMNIKETALAASDDKDINAWYVNASYMLTGESYASSYKGGVMERMSPKADYLGLGSPGWGAWEIGVRYSKFDAKDFDTNATAVNNSSTLSSNDVNSYTAGIKWITDPNTRFMLNYVYTDFNKSISGISSGVTSSGVPLHSNEKAVNIRAQFDF